MSRRWLVAVLLILVATLMTGVTTNSSLAIDVESHNMNLDRTSPIDGHSHLDGQWLGSHFASDGNVYFGTSTHSAHEGAMFLKYDRRTHEETVLCSDITTLTGDDPWNYPQGKLHSNMVEANGWVYWGTHFSSERPGDDAIWPGAHFQSYCMATGAFRDYGVVRANWTNYCAVGVDPTRNYGYIYVCPMWGPGRVYRIDLITGAKTDLGQPGSGGNVFSFFVDKRGDVWFSPAGDGGSLCVIRGATGTMQRYAGALPTSYTWDTNVPISDGGYTTPSSSLPPPATMTMWNDQTNRWIMWMQPLGDGDRAAFALGYYGGRLYTFDSTKDVPSGAAFSSVAHIGYSDLGLAVSGNKVFYYQRAGRGWYHQPIGAGAVTEITKDWHLLSCDLNPAVSPQIVDYGLIQDQYARNVWRLPAMTSDNSGGVYMTGDWWTDWAQPGVDDGTYRYHWIGADSWDQYPRGEQFARAEMPDVLADNFDDNTKAANWYLIQDNPPHVALNETNQRLELTSTTGSPLQESSYYSKGWRLDATRDFAVRVDWNLASVAGTNYGLSLKVARDQNNYIAYSADHTDVSGSKFEATGKTVGVSVTPDSAARAATSGTLYISYDSITDKLYISPIGYYRREDASQNDWIIPGLVQAQWSASTLAISLSGSSQGTTLASGDAYFDNFVLDDGTLVTPGTHTVSVSTLPVAGFPVRMMPTDNADQGDGTTSFTRTYDNGVPVSLNAWMTYDIAGTTYSFMHWELNGTAQPADQRALTVSAGADVTAVAVYTPGGPIFPVEATNLNVFCNRPHLDGQWFGTRYASDGNCYFGSSDHAAHEGAAFLKYNPRTRTPTLLQRDITNLTGDDPTVFPQGKLHSDIVEANGWVYWATHFSNDQIPNGDTNYPGSHFQGYNLTTGEFRDFGVLCLNCTCYAGVGVDVARNRAYVFACPITSVGFAASGGSHVYSFDLTTGVKTDLGILKPNTYDTMFFFFVDKRGDAWFNMAYDGGTLRVIRGATQTMQTYLNVLPPLTNWATDTVNSDPWYQANRWIDWMQPLADGNRAVFHEGFYGGRIYIFDSTKDIASGAAFTSPAHIGPADAAMAVNGNKVFYIQRAGRQQGWQQDTDFHLLSVDLNTAVSPQIVDYGLIQDQIGRIPWRIPSMMTDNGGTIFMTGDWWTDWLLPGVDDGTYRYIYNAAHVPPEYYDQYPRGEQFGRGDIPDVLTDNFDDNSQGANWYLIQPDPTNVWLSESNQTLNLLSTTSSAGTTAAYHSKGWRLDTTRDFACRVDWQLLNSTAPSIDLSLKISKDLNNCFDYSVNRVAPAGPRFDAAGLTAGAPVTIGSAARSSTSGTLYISYDSILDRLYFSPHGYYRREEPTLNDWAIEGVVRGQWNAASLSVMLSGSVRGAQLITGQALFDNFVLDDGTLITPPTRSLTIDSNPMTGVSIDATPIDNNGQSVGTTTFTRVYDEGALVILTAPGSFNDAGTLRGFVRWTVNGVPQPSSVVTANLNVGVSTTAVAIYSVPSSGFTILRQQGGPPEEIMNIDETTGNVFALGSFLATSLDLAENFDAGEQLEVGSVVVIDPKASQQLILCRKAYDSTAAGIISYQPGLLLGKGMGPVPNSKAALALAGRTPCKVDASYGAIKVGDLLTTSPTPGRAMKAEPDKIVQGCIVGKALEPLDAGLGVIKVMITLQ